MLYSIRIMLLLLTCLFALSLACSPTPEENGKEAILVFDEEDLPSPIALRGKKYNFTQFLALRRILCIGDYLVVSEKTNGDLLHILDMKPEKYVRSIGENGLGPIEASMVWKLEIASEMENFWSYDVKQKVSARYVIKDSTSKLAKNQLRLGEIFYYAWDMTWASDTSLMVTMVDGNDKCFEVSLQGDTLATFGT